MSYTIDDAERSSASEILIRMPRKIASDLQQEASHGLPDARRVADLEVVMSQLRADIAAVQAGDRAVSTRELCDSVQRGATALIARPTPIP